MTVACATSPPPMKAGGVWVLLESSDFPMHFYHRTTRQSLDAILRDGLLPRDPAETDPSLDYQPRGIYLWRHYADAVGNKRRNDNGVVITVDIPERSVIDDWEFDACDCCDKSCAVVCLHAIPASRFVAVHQISHERTSIS